MQTDRTSYRTGERIRISVFPSTGRTVDVLRGEIYADGDSGAPVKTFIPAPGGGGREALEAVTGDLPPGDYSIRVRSGTGGGAEGSASFTVEELSVELLRTSGDAELLGRIAASTGGRLLRPEEAGGLAASAGLESDTLVTASSRKLRGSIWLLAVIVAVFAAEWLIRKRLGLV